MKFLSLISSVRITQTKGVVDDPKEEKAVNEVLDDDEGTGGVKEQAYEKLWKTK